MRNYEKGFDYDTVGNLLETKHQAGDTSWKRLYDYESPSTLDSNDMDNRLTKTTVGSDETAYGYDVHGNMTDTAHLSKMEWGFQDQLFATAKQEVNNGEPETTYYVYDAGGQRVRKVTEREDLNGSGDPKRKNERIYLGDFEIYREYENDDQEPVETERKTLHVSDDHSRIALIETKTVDDSQNVSDPQPLVRHQLGDHLNSASLELDETGSIISYEEYYPYGSTSYQAVDSATEVSAKRYRYTGKERDEETGFYYHGARYYAPWLARWTSPDPAGMVDGPNLYEYVKGNPVKLRDPDGMYSTKASLQAARTTSTAESSDETVLHLREGNDVPLMVWHSMLDPGDRGLTQYIHAHVSNLNALDFIGGPDLSLIQEIWTPARRPAEDIDSAADDSIEVHEDTVGEWATQDGYYKTKTPGPFSSPHYARLQWSEEERISSAGRLTGAATLDLGLDSPVLGDFFQNQIMHDLMGLPHFDHQNSTRPYFQMSAAALVSSDARDGLEFVAGASAELGTHESLVGGVGGISYSVDTPSIIQQVNIWGHGTLEYGASSLLSSRVDVQQTGVRVLGEVGIGFRFSEQWSGEIGVEADYNTVTPSIGHTREFLGVSRQWGDDD